jgi:hypothetical protein
MKFLTLEISLPPHAPDISNKFRNFQNNMVGEDMVSVNDKIIIVNCMLVANRNRCSYNNLEPFNA